MGRLQRVACGMFFRAPSPGIHLLYIILYIRNDGRVSSRAADSALLYCSDLASSHRQLPRPAPHRCYPRINVVRVHAMHSTWSHLIDLLIS